MLAKEILMPLFYTRAGLWRVRILSSERKFLMTELFGEAQRKPLFFLYSFSLTLLF